MAKIVLTEDDGRTRTFSEGGTPPPSGGGVITYDRNRDGLPVFKRVTIYADPKIVYPGVYLTQGDPDNFDKNNDPLIFADENTIGNIPGYKMIVLDLAPYKGDPPPDDALYRQVSPHLATCRGVYVKSELGQACAGRIDVLD